MMFSNFQMPSKRDKVKAKSDRKFWWIIIKLLIYIARLIVRFVGGDDFDDLSNLAEMVLFKKEFNRNIL